ncbi:alcohol dehydrogenase catalytic domain-containing protein [Faunimonas pinastri]|nr:alcohol dehydrogenase catalytic domain-containing protein [Faunimonas pinastri]
MTDEPDFALPVFNRFWPFQGGGVRDLGVAGRPVEQEFPPPGDDEVIARIDAACICSSDVKIIRMGASHPLFQARDLASEPVVLGHEMALTVVAVGARWKHRYRSGDRLGLQPALTGGPKRLVVGMDLPGAMAEYIRLDGRVLGDSDGAGSDAFVFPLPQGMSSAAAALLEPYSCVEAAYRPNSRTDLKAGGRMLVVGLPGGAAMHLSSECRPAEAVLVAAPAALAEWAGARAGAVRELARLEDVDGAFDDIVLCGDDFAEAMAALIPHLAPGGMMTLAGRGGDDPVPVDPARIHYQSLSFVGTPGPEIGAAFDPARNRFELRPGGVALVLGAGGAMGRIHVHRALEMADGPATVIATTRQAHRIEALERDFGAIAERRGRRLIVVAEDRLPATLAGIAPQGCDDIAVVAPDAAVVERAAGWMKPDGMLVIFAGTAYGQPCRLPLGRVASAGARFTGSTGSAVADQLAVLARVTEADFDILGNLEAVAGFDAVPEAFAAVTEGRLSGKVAIFPGVPDLPFTLLRDAEKPGGESAKWSLAAEQALHSKNRKPGQPESSSS